MDLLLLRDVAVHRLLLDLDLAEAGLEVAADLIARRSDGAADLLLHLDGHHLARQAIGVRRLTALEVGVAVREDEADSDGEERPRVREE